MTLSNSDRLQTQARVSAERRTAREGKTSATMTEFQPQDPRTAAVVEACQVLMTSDAGYSSAGFLRSVPTKGNTNVRNTPSDQACQVIAAAFADIVTDLSFGTPLDPAAKARAIVAALPKKQQAARIKAYEEIGLDLSEPKEAEASDTDADDTEF